MRIIGIDPSLRSTGYAVIETAPRNPRALAFGVIANPPARPQSASLLFIYQYLHRILETHRPDVAAVEGVIYVQNRRIAITLGAARGAAMVAIAESGIPIYEYPARSIKKATTGYGAAAKCQVGFMMRAIFQLTRNPTPDEADALAIALTHAQAASAKTNLAQKL